MYIHVYVYVCIYIYIYIYMFNHKWILAGSGRQLHASCLCPEVAWISFLIGF